MRDTADVIGAVREKTLDEEWPRELRGVNYIEGEAAGVRIRFSVRGRRLQMMMRERGLARENYRDKYAHCIVCTLSLCVRVLHKRIYRCAYTVGGCEKERRRHHIHRRW